ncbi:phosphatase PAP2 family protein [Ligilactobacillus salivarius]|jgi:membrane-associated phospholipid phosphatase|uniref:Phosphatidylglycerophosphatase B n=2 Tax=Ligilactobacillus salivarius TaxID=1624 RepID=Q1WS41_LIGS1|nr:phosphatase PAP2 family protein [Ligilactobacillus salivarius]ABE00288.1 Phosphatidylglycerophosphatase B [Ligilactobacillus salivarius UCC118]EFK80764.1 PAP2 family protein [Ligilactobacillus salivarius ACS-116-V-Col5a]MDE1525594.1 phosphatase PAP2 family protein [Ligilactobacillus salivarius]MYU58335.1 phosphatase PAP2 family protein [Ligilactobacillus salivarius]MYU60292.1 phosphatase PAP2 family protein [Ligilactobacillus salivarius]
MFVPQNKYRPFIASIYLALFLILLILVKTNSTIVTSFDKFVQNLLLPITNPTNTRIVEKITYLGGPRIAAILSIIVSLYMFIRHNFKAGIWSASTLVIGNLINVLAKNLIQRPRPSDKLVAIGGYSFPSGHTFGTALFIFFVVFLIVPQIKDVTLRRILTFLGFLWILIIALTRVYLHVHYPTDTIASILLVLFLWESSLIIWRRISD